MGMFGVRERHEGGGRLMTKQADAQASDINAIVNRYVVHGIAPPVGGRAARYGDFSDAPSAFEAMTRVAELEEQFGQLPASVRDRCDNDPVKFLALVDDPEQLELLREAGLVKEAEPVKEPVSGTE